MSCKEASSAQARRDLLPPLGESKARPWKAADSCEVCQPAWEERGVPGVCILLV